MARFDGFGPDPDDDFDDISEVSREDWREFCRLENPEWTDAQCDRDWAKHLKRTRRGSR